MEEAVYEPARSQHQSADVVKGLLYNIPQRPEDAFNHKGRKQGEDGSMSTVELDMFA